MSEYTEIFLQPECCAGPYNERVWCEHDAPEDCEEGVRWARFVNADRFAELEAENARLLARVAKWEAFCKEWALTEDEP